METKTSEEVLAQTVSKLGVKLAAANESVSILEAQVLTLRQERDAFRAELDEGAMIQALNDIWKAVDDGLGDWEYPGQIVRAVWKATDTWPKREE